MGPGEGVTWGYALKRDTVTVKVSSKRARAPGGLVSRPTRRHTSGAGVWVVWRGVGVLFPTRTEASCATRRYRHTGEIRVAGRSRDGGVSWASTAAIKTALLFSVVDETKYQPILDTMTITSRYCNYHSNRST